MNAAANNMSLLAVHSFELGYHVEQQCKDQVMQEKIVRNIEGHTKFIKQKSEEMRKKLEKLAESVGSLDRTKIGAMDKRIQAARRKTILSKTQK